MSEERPPSPRIPKTIAKKAHKIATGPLMAPLNTPASAAPIEEQARIQTLGNFLRVRSALGIGESRD